jgi:D-beta-D-heptose 7-phosphate kinase/D-beta-D-heptose 1-phosphate adenosyltransferase
VEDIAGGECVQNNGGDVIILSFKDNCSTSAIVKRIQEKEA